MTNDEIEKLVVPSEAESRRVFRLMRSVHISKLEWADFFAPGYLLACLFNLSIDLLTKFNWLGAIVFILCLVWLPFAFRRSDFLLRAHMASAIMAHSSTNALLSKILSEAEDAVKKAEAAANVRVVPPDGPGPS